MRLLIGIIGFFTRQTVYWKFSQAVMCIGKLTKLSNVLCKNTKMGDRRKKKKKKKNYFIYLFIFFKCSAQNCVKDKECK